MSQTLVLLSAHVTTQLSFDWSVIYTCKLGVSSWWYMFLLLRKLWHF